MPTKKQKQKKRPHQWLKIVPHSHLPMDGHTSLPFMLLINKFSGVSAILQPKSVTASFTQLLLPAHWTQLINIIILHVSATSTPPSSIPVLPQHHHLASQCYLNTTILHPSATSTPPSCISVLPQHHHLASQCYLNTTILHLSATATPLSCVSALPHHHCASQCCLSITILCNV